MTPTVDTENTATHCYEEIISLRANALREHGMNILSTVSSLITLVSYGTVLNVNGSPLTITSKSTHNRKFEYYGFHTASRDYVRVPDQIVNVVLNRAVLKDHEGKDVVLEFIFHKNSTGSDYYDGSVLPVVNTVTALLPVVETSSVDIPNPGILVHPGSILKNVILPELNITSVQAAEELGVSKVIMSRIMNENSSITPEFALRLEMWLGNENGRSAEEWIKMQTAYDLSEAKKKFETEGIFIEKSTVLK